MNQHDHEAIEENDISKKVKKTFIVTLLTRCGAIITFCCYFHFKTLDNTSFPFLYSINNIETKYFANDRLSAKNQ